MNTINPERANNLKKSMVFFFISLILTMTTVTVGNETGDIIANNIVYGFSVLALVKAIVLMVRD